MTAGCEALARPRRYAELKRRVSSCLVTTGEHEYSRYGFRELLERRCADVLQPDITWLGGITEARRVTAMAAGFDVPIVPHGSSLAARAPFRGSQPPVPRQPLQRMTVSHASLHVNFAWPHLDSRRRVPSAHSQYPDDPDGTWASQPRSLAFSRLPAGLHPAVARHPRHADGVP